VASRRFHSVFHPTSAAARLLTTRWAPGFRLLIVGLILFSLVGCQRFRLGGLRACFPRHGSSVGQTDMTHVKKFSSYVSPRFVQRPPIRVALIPTNLSSGNYDASTKFLNALAGEIRLAGLFEVIQPRQFHCKTTVDEILMGRFDEREITRLARTYHCDAIMLVRMNQFQGHWPLKTGITAAMVDANESIVIFSVDGNWDTADPEIQQSYRWFVNQRTTDVPAPAREIYLQSPENLFAFVANQITTVMSCGQ